MKKIFESRSEEETERIAAGLAEKAGPGMVITLDGDLGVGKTVFTKGFGAGLGIKTVINSPTFTILKTYEEGRIPLAHFDVYRIIDPLEMDETGYEDYFFGNYVSLVEWADNISELIPEDAVHISIEKDLKKGFDYRKITVTKNEREIVK